MKDSIYKHLFYGCSLLCIAAVYFAGCAGTPRPASSRESIQQMILAGKSEQVRELFQTKTDVNAVDEQGNTALHAAATVNDAALITFLLYKGADSEIKNEAGDTALHTALKSEAKEAAAVLAALGNNIFAKDEEGSTALEKGLARGTLFYEALLTPYTAGLHDEQGQTVIHYLVKAKNLDGIRFCIHKKLPLSAKDTNGVSALALAYTQKDLPSAYIAAELILGNAAPERGRHAYFEDAVKTRNPSMRFNDGQSPLHIAVILGETGIVRYLIEQGADIKAKDISGSTALHEAMRYGRPDIAVILLDAGADINARDSIGKTPLLIITPEKNRQEMYRLLLSRNAQANITDTFGDNALHIATMTKTEVAVLKELSERAADINGRNKKGVTPLAQAVERRNTAHIGFFASRGADIHAEDIDGNTPFTRALEANLDIIKLLINASTVNTRDSLGNTPLHIAVFKQAAPEYIRFLLDSGAEINARNRNGDSPLYTAVRQNSRLTGEMLLARGADVFATNTANYSPLRLALSAGGEVLDWLLTSEVIKAFDGIGNTPLHYAAEWKSDSSAAVIIEKGAPIDAQNANGESAVFSALKAESDSTVKLLLKHGANKNIRDYWGNTPLHACVRWDAEKSALLFLKSGSDVNAKNLSGKTALHEAARSSRKNIAQLLLTNDADINAADTLGRTPLMDAVQTGDSDMCALLLKNGASPSIQDMYGRTAYHEAAETAHQKLIRQLRLAGGNPLARDTYGNTPLSLAFAKDAAVIEAVLGTDVNLADSDGNTPIHIAVESSITQKTLSVLLGLGYPADRRNRQGTTPLMLAVKDGKQTAAQILLESDADPFVTDNSGECALSFALKHNGEILNIIVQNAGTKRDIAGETILHYAAREADTATIQRLLSMGIDKTAKNISGETAYDIAIRWKRPEAAALLK